MIGWTLIGWPIRNRDNKESDLLSIHTRGRDLSGSLEIHHMVTLNKIKGFSDSWRRMLETKYVGVNFEMLVTDLVVVVTEICGTNINKLSTWYLFCHQHRKIVTCINVAELTNDSTDNLKIINLWVWSLGLKYFLSLYRKNF